MTTAAQLSRYIEAKKADAYKVSKAAFFEICNDIILNTPVREGFARGSWTFSEGSTNARFRTGPDKSGQGSLFDVRDGIEMAREGATLYLLTNLVYMPRLEYGWSMQAPAGMVRRAIANFERELEKRINEL